MMEDIRFSSDFRGLEELVNDWALRQLLELKSTIVATLTAQDEVPPNSTKSTGAFELELTADGGISNYILRVRDIGNVTSVHLHQGIKGTNGPIVITLKNPSHSIGQKMTYHHK